MKRITLSFAFFVFCIVSLQAQTNVVKRTSVSYQANESQWEYLVITFGKTTFGTPEKMMAYKVVGIENVNEALDLQKNLDILGRFGWELVNTVGMIAGDQELILKRKYNKDRSAKEYGLIQSGKELYLKDLQDIVQRSLKLDEERQKYEEELKNCPRLIELDEQERQKVRDEKKVILENSYKQHFENTDIAKKSTFSFDYKSSYSNDIKIEIKMDLTDKFLVNGNSYHKTEIENYIKSFLDSYKFRNTSLEAYDGISIFVTGTIKFNNEDVYVGSGYATQSYSNSSWSISTY